AWHPDRTHRIYDDGGAGQRIRCYSQHGDRRGWRPDYRLGHRTAPRLGAGGVGDEIGSVMSAPTNRRLPVGRKEVPAPAGTSAGGVGVADSHPELLSAWEVSALTGVPVSTLHAYAQRRELGMPPDGPPHVKLGPRRRRWLRTDVLAWIDSCR